MDKELVISGIGISEEVTTAIVRMAVEKVAGVASVGTQDLLSDIRNGLVSLFTQQPVVVDKPIACSYADGGLTVDVHLAVFFGYRFTKLAEDVRNAAGEAIAAQIGVPVTEVNVYIDEIVFPKE